MFEWITRPLFRRLVEGRIKASLNALTEVDKHPSSDPAQVRFKRLEREARLKHWLAVAQGGKFTQDSWQYQFYNPAPPAPQTNPLQKETIPENHSLAEFMLAQSDRLLAIANKPTLYQKIKGRLLYGKYYRSRYRNQSQSYYHEAFKLWHAHQKPEGKNPGEAIIPLALTRYQRFLLRRITRLGLTWEFKAQDFRDTDLFLKKIRMHEKIDEANEENESKAENKNSKENKDSLSQEDLANLPTTGTYPDSPARLREPHTKDQLLSRSNIHVILGRMTEKKGDMQANVTQPANAPKQSAHPIPTHMTCWVTSKPTLTMTQSIDQVQRQAQKQSQDVSQTQQREVEQLEELERVEDKQRWMDNSTGAYWYPNGYGGIQKQESFMDVSVAHWMNKLRDAMERAYQITPSLHCDPSKIRNGHGGREGWSDRPASFRTKITQSAEQALRQSKGHIRGDEHVDLDALPLGFFIERESDSNTFVLKYNEQYRLHQLANDPYADIRLDPKEKNNDFLVTETDLVCAISKEDLLRTLQEKEIKLEKRHLQFLNQLDQETHFIKFWLPSSYASKPETRGRRFGYEDPAPPAGDVTIFTKSFAFRALQQMALKGYPYLGDFIDVLSSFSEANEETLLDTHVKAQDKSLTSYSDDAEKLRQQNAAHKTYLTHFILAYLKHVKGDEFSGKAEREALKRFQLIIKNKEEFGWLDALQRQELAFMHTQHPYIGPVRHVEIQLNFSEISKGLFCFFDYFKTLGLPLPSIKGHEEMVSFASLRRFIDCIQLAGHGKDPEIKRFQAQLIFELPPSIADAKKALKAGYAFVHKDMLLGEKLWDAQGELTKILEDINPKTLDEIKNIYTANANQRLWQQTKLLKALYLRYIACCIKPARIKEAFEQWENIMGEVTAPILEDNEMSKNRYSALGKALTERWDELQRYARTLTHILDNPAPTEAAQEAVKKTEEKLPDGFANDNLVRAELEKHYPEDEIDALLKRLSLSNTLENDLKETIQAVNACTATYASRDWNTFKEDLNHIREKPLAERIAILRQLHYRLSALRSKATPPQGEWMRLEQLVAMLIAMKQDSLLQIDTSEGKTLILQMIAILKALDGKKINVITHNEMLALDAGSKIKKIARYLGLKTAIKTNNEPGSDSDQAVIDADILYTDIASAVINDLLAKANKKEGAAQDNPLPGDRKTTDAIVDEVDNVIIDIHGMTTMQVSKAVSEATPAFTHFLIALNKIIREQLPKETGLVTKEAQRVLIKQALDNDPSLKKNDAFYKRLSEEELDKLIAAAVSAMGLKKNKDYIVAKKRDGADPHSKEVFIVHESTTGRVDKLSKWGEYVHQCVAAWEQSQGEPHVIIPGIADPIETGDVISYLQDKAHYTSLMGVSGTLGDHAVKSEIAKALQVTDEPVLSVIFPRAKRHLGKKANWPLRVTPETTGTDHPEYREEYNRVYHFPPIITPNKISHREKLLETIQLLQQYKLSCIVCLSTIEECNDLFNYLAGKDKAGRGVERCNLNLLQILDDTPEEAEEGRKFRHPESEIIERSNLPGMITLTTAVGGRGTDFEKVLAEIRTKPSLERVGIQAEGRVGRNGEQGIILEIYNEEDFDNTLESLAKMAAQAKQSTPTDDQAATPKVADQTHHFSFSRFLKHLFRLNKVSPTPPKLMSVREHHRFFPEAEEKKREREMLERVARKHKKT
jgi:preprotein translocase subunit SecA